MNLKNRILFNLTKKIILKNKNFKGIHNGESCYLFGNAKSLKYYDLSLFNDRVSIGCNSLFLHKDFGDMRMSYYYIGHSFFYYPYWRNIYTGKRERNIIGSLYAAKFRENSDVNIFINVSDYPSLRGENIFYFHNFDQHFTDYVDCSLDGVFSATQSALSGMLGVALFLGFKDVTLVGCDHLLRPKASEHFYEYGMLDEVNSSIMGQEILASAQKFVKLRVVSPSNIYRGDLIPHIQYDELTGQNPQFKENYEIISKDDLSVLINCNLPYSITEDEFK